MVLFPGVLNLEFWTIFLGCLRLLFTPTPYWQLQSSQAAGRMRSWKS